VGTFLPGGPIPTKFAAYTQPGQVLDPKRILVGSASNFGEALADANQLPGSFLSIQFDQQSAGAHGELHGRDQSAGLVDQQRVRAYGRPTRRTGSWAASSGTSTSILHATKHATPYRFVI
jgi:hypothetical protein